MQIKNLENGMAVGQRVAAELVRRVQGVFPTPSQVVLQSLKIRFGKRSRQIVLSISTRLSLPIPPNACDQH